MKAKKLNESIAQVCCANLFGYRANLIVPNLSWGWGLNHEADLIVISKAGYVTEVEIKISKSDLKADFNKLHNHDSKKIHRLFYAVTQELVDLALEIVPKKCGIIVIKKSENNRGYYYSASFKRGCRKDSSKPPIPQSDILKAAELGCMRIWTLKTKLNGYVNN
jgi:hypothetical protein